MHCTANRLQQFVTFYLFPSLTHTLFQTLLPLHELYVLEEACACVFVHACLYMCKGVEQFKLFMISETTTGWKMS